MAEITDVANAIFKFKNDWIYTNDKKKVSDEDKEKFVARTSNKQALCSSESFSNTRILNSLLKRFFISFAGIFFLVFLNIIIWLDSTMGDEKLK